LQRYIASVYGKGKENLMSLTACTMLLEEGAVLLRDATKAFGATRFKSFNASTVRCLYSTRVSQPYDGYMATRFVFDHRKDGPVRCATASDINFAKTIVDCSLKTIVDTSKAYFGFTSLSSKLADSPVVGADAAAPLTNMSDRMGVEECMLATKVLSTRGFHVVVAEFPGKAEQAMNVFKKLHEFHLGLYVDIEHVSLNKHKTLFVDGLSAIQSVQGSAARLRVFLKLLPPSAGEQGQSQSSGSHGGPSQTSSQPGPSQSTSQSSDPPKNDSEALFPYAQAGIKEVVHRPHPSSKKQ